MNPLDLIPAPYSLIAKIALPLLALFGVYIAGEHNGSTAATDRLIAKYQPTMERAQASINLTAESIRRQRAEAAAADLRHAAEVTAAYTQGTQESANELESQLEAARAAAHARSLSNGAQAGAAIGSGGGGQNVPTSANTASGTDAARQTAELDDVACAEGVTKAQGWLDWWTKVMAVPR